MKPITAGPDDAVAGPAPQTASAGWALASLSLPMLLSTLGISIANVGLPTLAQAFGASFQQVQWVVLAYLLAITTLVVSAGRLGDIIGRRRLLLAGLSLFTLASVLCGFAPTLWLLVAARAAQGLGAAVMMALAMALVGETVPKARTGSAMGLLGTMSAVGTALGPTLGGVLIALLVLAPEGLAAIGAARSNDMQRTINVLLGSAVATIGLTVPAIMVFRWITGLSPELGLEPPYIVLLATTLLLSAINLTRGRVNALQGLVHLLVFFAWIAVIFDEASAG